MPPRSRHSRGVRSVVGSLTLPIRPVRLLVDRLRSPVFWLGTGLALICGWVFWPILLLIAHAWRTAPEYSHGFLVPLFAMYLLYHRRALLRDVRLRASWLGLLFLAVGCCLLLLGAFVGVDYLNGVALVPTLLGIAALLGGTPAVRWAWVPAMFLLFMIPLPFRLAHGLSGPLRGVATFSSGYVLQAIGFPVVMEGHTLLVRDYQIGIAEACSGLSMLFVFVAIAFAVAITSRRPWLDRVVVVLAAVPIAVVANVVRITLTAVAYWGFGKRLGDLIFHDLSGWLMMPLALGMLWLVLKLIDTILIPAEERSPPLPAGDLFPPKAAAG